VENTNSNKAAKYKWSYDVDTQSIQSVGAKENSDKDLCWQISSLERFGKQRIKLANCDAEEIRQKFAVVDGRLHMFGEEKLCVGIEEHKLDVSSESIGIALTTMRCYSGSFGTCDVGDLDESDYLVSSDSSIKPFGDSTNCLFKRYSGYNTGDEIWIQACDSENANSAKAGKYTFSYDKATGLIASEGSRLNDPENVFCLTINSNDRFYKQRVKLAECDSENELQTFDYRDGRIYSRGNLRLCAGLEFEKLAADGKTAFVFSTCYPSVFAFESEA